MSSVNATFPYESATAVVTSDATVLAPTRGLYVGGAGALTVTMADGTDAVFSAVPVGTTLPVNVQKVKAATTATLILALR